LELELNVCDKLHNWMLHTLTSIDWHFDMTDMKKRPSDSEKNPKVFEVCECY
jgi:hypothetical protein